VGKKTVADELDEESGPACRLVPVLPLKDLCLFPGASLALLVSRPFAVAGVLTAERCGGALLALAQRDPTAERPGLHGLHAVGTLASVREALAVSPGELRVELDARARSRVRSLVGQEMLVAEVEAIPEGDAGDEWGSAVEALARYLHAHSDLRAFLDQQRRAGDPMAWVNLACQHLPITASARQKLLEATAAERCTRIGRGLDALLRKESSAPSAP
jgi:ATP-dependent Lon protease